MKKQRCKQLKSIYFFTVLMLTISVLTFGVHASLGTFKVNSTVPIRVLANCSSVNITEVTNNNQTFTINKPMTFLGGQTFIYYFNNTTTLDTYTYSWNNPCVDCSQNNCGNDFYISNNGRPEASGGVVVLFVVIFLILVGATCYLALYSIGHLINKDFDIIDLSIDWGLFFVILALYFLENYYLSNPAIDTYLLWFLGIGGVVLLILPFIALIMSIVSGSFTKQGYKFRVPKQRHLG